MLLIHPITAVILPALISGHALASANNTSTEQLSAQLDQAIQHNAAIEAHLLQSPIRGVKKMSTDEGEKFFLDYWQFEDGVLVRNEVDGVPDVEAKSDINPRSSPLQPAFARDDASYSLFRRDFKCPSDTDPCNSINRPDRCCKTGYTCELIPDRGAEDVGCCPRGETCSDIIGSCGAEYTACSEALGGGCCIPGYDCVTGGCEFPGWNAWFDGLVMSATGAHVSTVTVTVHSSVEVSTTTYTTSQQTRSLPSTSATASTTTATTTATSTESTTGDLVPPARPTSLSTATAEHTNTLPITSACPTGFYACSAVYQGGCCRTGRDCETTSCPVTSSTTVVSSGVTVVVPAPNMTPRGGHCAQGWFSCADTAGGGCCPRGFACGSSCSATAGSTKVPKLPPQKAGSGRTWGGISRLEIAVLVAGMMMTYGLL